MSDAELLSDLGRKPNSFAQDIRSTRRAGPSVDLMNRFGTQTATEAKELLTEADARALVSDPRMTRWMQEQGVEVDQLTLDRMIQNRMIPSARKLTQYAPSTTNGQKLGKFTGNDIQWRHRDAVTQDNFVTPEEARLPRSVGTSGSMQLDPRPSETVYRQLVSQKLNGVQGQPQIHVGKGINAGMSYTDGTAEGSSNGSGAAAMNLHYGLVRPELRDPGQQRNTFGYQDASQMDTSATMPTTAQMAAETGGVYELRQDFAEKKELHLEKFTSEEYTSTTRAARSLRDIIRERQDASYTREPHAGELETDARVFQTQMPKPDFAKPRDAADSHDVSLHEIADVRTQHGRGRTLKDTLASTTEYIFHESRDPDRSAHELLHRTEVRRDAHVSGADIGDATHSKKRTLAGTLATIKSHGGRANMTSEVGAVTTKRSEAMHDLPQNPVRNVAQFDARMETGAQTSMHRTEVPMNYVPPGKSLARTDTRMEPVTNSNDMSSMRVSIGQPAQHPTQRANDLRPTSVAPEQAGRRLTEQDQPIKMTIRQERGSVRKVATQANPMNLGAATRGGRKVPEMNVMLI